MAASKRPQDNEIARELKRRCLGATAEAVRGVFAADSAGLMAEATREFRKRTAEDMAAPAKRPTVSRSADRSADGSADGSADRSADGSADASVDAAFSRGLTKGIEISQQLLVPRAVLRAHDECELLLQLALDAQRGQIMRAVDTHIAMILHERPPQAWGC